MTWGLHYRSVLSISTIIRIVDLLASADIFDENDQSDDFALELHLRCLVAALRVLTLFGTYNCVGFLTFDLLEKLYNSLAKWAHYHSLRSQKGYRSHYSGSLQNYNNEFLIVYARDLVASVSSDRDLMIQAVARVAAGVNLTHSVLQISFRCLTRSTPKELLLFLKVSLQMFNNDLPRQVGIPSSVP